MEEKANKLGIINCITAIALVITTIGLLVITYFQFAVMRDSYNRDAYIKIIDGIIELKKYSMDEQQIVNQLATFESDKNILLIDALNKSGAITGKDANALTKDMLVKCTFFYHVEKLYFLSKKSNIPEHGTKGFTTEIEMWLSVPGMREFFNNFCKKYRPHSPEFIKAVDKFYNPGLN